MLLSANHLTADIISLATGPDTRITPRGKSAGVILVSTMVEQSRASVISRCAVPPLSRRKKQVAPAPGLKGLIRAQSPRRTPGMGRGGPFSCCQIQVMDGGGIMALQRWADERSTVGVMLALPRVLGSWGGASGNSSARLAEV